MASGLFLQNDMEAAIRHSRCRNAPFTSAEKEKLFRLIGKYSEVLENKKKAVAPRERSRAWLMITTEFNTQPCEYRRETKQLRKMWDNVKFRLRKDKRFDDGDIVLQAYRGLFGRQSELSSPFPNDEFSTVCKTEADDDLHSSTTEHILEDEEDLTETQGMQTTVPSPAAMATAVNENEPSLDSQSHQDKQGAQHLGLVMPWEKDSSSVEAKPSGCHCKWEELKLRLAKLRAEMQQAHEQHLLRLEHCRREYEQEVELRRKEGQLRLARLNQELENARLVGLILQKQLTGGP